MLSTKRSTFLLFFYIGFLNAKVYERCELARELLDIHEIPRQQLATWVCIAKHESDFNTSARNHGSGDHGLFQISGVYWCSPGGFACGVSCSDLEDDDIEDDVICTRRIYREHKRLSGDGFNAWVVYKYYCKNNPERYIEGCFPDLYNIKVEDNIVNAEHSTEKITTKPESIISVPYEIDNRLSEKTSTTKEKTTTTPKISTTNEKFSTITSKATAVKEALTTIPKTSTTKEKLTTTTPKVSTVKETSSTTTSNTSITKEKLIATTPKEKLATATQSSRSASRLRFLKPTTEEAQDKHMLYKFGKIDYTFTRKGNGFSLVQVKNK